MSFRDRNINKNKMSNLKFWMKFLENKKFILLLFFKNCKIFLKKYNLSINIKLENLILLILNSKYFNNILNWCKGEF